MDAKTNGKLKQLIEEVQQTENESKIAIPFVPYVGSDYWIARKKVLIVGKATDGWGWKDGSWNKEATLKDVDLSQTRWFENLEEIAHQFIEKKIIPFYSNKEGYSSLFWNRIYRILGKLLKEQPLHCYRRDPEIAKDVFRSFAWTNVFKVTHTRGNPKKKLREKQIEYDILKDEIEFLQPHAILFFTSPSYDKHLKEVLPGIHIENKSIAEIGGLGNYAFAGVALRTYHPQYYRFDMHEVVAKLVFNA